MPIGFGMRRKIFMPLSFAGPGDTPDIDKYVIRYKMDGTDTALTSVGGTKDIFEGPWTGDNLSTRFYGDGYYTSSERVKLTDIADGAFTMTFWVKCYSTASFDSICGIGDANTGGIRIIINPDGELRYRIAGTTSNFDTIGKIDYGNWTHIAIRFYGSGLGKEAIVNERGQIEKIQTITNAGETYNLSTTSSAFNVGAGENASGEFIGNIDDFRIYPFLLSDNDISKLANNTLAYPDDLITDFSWYDIQNRRNFVSSAGQVQTWIDSGNLGNDLTQATAGLQPILSDDYLSFSTGQILNKTTPVGLLSATGEHTMVVEHNIFTAAYLATASSPFVNILQLKSTAAGVLVRRPWLYYGRDYNIFRHSVSDNTGSTVDITDTNYNGWNAITPYQQADGNEIWIRGAFVNYAFKVPDTTTTSDYLLIGDSNSTNMTVEYADIIIKASVLSTTIKEKLEGFCEWRKSGANNNLVPAHPYKSKPPVI